MNLFRTWWADEPARFWAAAVIFINAVLALLVSLDVLPLDGTQVALLYLVVLGGAALVGGEDVRRRVTPTGTAPADDA
jgi:hypothetical protein